MGTVKLLSEDQVNAVLQELPGWSYTGGSIKKRFEFGDFSEAFAFLTRIALISEKMNHHANWSGVYNIVNLELSTHDAGGVTEKDTRFALEAEAIRS